MSTEEASLCQKVIFAHFYKTERYIEQVEALARKHNLLIDEDYSERADIVVGSFLYKNKIDFDEEQLAYVRFDFDFYAKQIMEPQMA